MADCTRLEAEAPGRNAKHTRIGLRHVRKPLGPGFAVARIRPVSSRSTSAQAVTVNARPADKLMVHKALQAATPGDIVVVSIGGNTTSAVFGELMCHTACAAGLGGIVVDGAIRDVAGITRLGFPAFWRTVSPGACDKDGPGEINVPISCGGTVVCPGDIVVGDSDDVTVVPRGDAEAVLKLVAELMARESKRIAEIKGGGPFKGEIDDTLRKHGIVETATR